MTTIFCDHTLHDFDNSNHLKTIFKKFVDENMFLIWGDVHSTPFEEWFDDFGLDGGKKKDLVKDFIPLLNEEFDRYAAFYLEPKTPFQNIKKY